MKIYFVYILKCSDNSYYTGITNNLERRIIEHQEGLDKKAYTFKRRSIKLAYFESFNEINYAIEWEKKIKGWSRKKKECLINDNFEKLKELSVCQNDSHYKNKPPFDSAQADTELN
tara:strand:+ start:8224 stop:8571 length:348 start_codon:yes stop_codon:yes gene_type:complete